MTGPELLQLCRTERPGLAWVVSCEEVADVEVSAPLVGNTTIRVEARRRGDSVYTRATVIDLPDDPKREPDLLVLSGDILGEDAVARAISVVEVLTQQRRNDHWRRAHFVDEVAAALWRSRRAS